MRHGLQHATDGPKWLDKAIALEEPCDIPAVWGNHGLRMILAPKLQKRMPNAFMFSMIRHPVARAMSQFYFRVQQGMLEPGEEDKLQFLRETSPSFLSDYLAGGEGDTLEAILASYDFIGITERFDESLLLFGRMLNVSVLDLLYLPASGFKEDLSRFQNMLARVHEVCVGQEEPCLWSDNGCGQQCIDDLIANEFLPGRV
eukprot:CAMPEP_0168492870 /NCGR_PEP_ID=MMETSP0228-20121227/70436_1 /TAXON_ID=133427 /ORGANISM="Protoceratium reticulatum, Strain CCCM 535 (=CCMP 1889)" /LENGTH=200 /DNA_ID=CAMNT_0008509655 /DNA_START=72 /DNA_END=675 /DNA_ORIENTATION=-